jgi:hypothetical protein
MRSRKTSTRRASGRRTSKINRQWTRQECAFMRKFYRTTSTRWVARQLGRSVYSVRYKAVDLSIKKANPSVWKANSNSTSSNWKKSGSRTTGRSSNMSNYSRGKSRFAKSYTKKYRRSY